MFSKRISSGKYDPVEEARRYLSKTGRTIVVSFTADPYPPEEREKELTRRVLEVLAMNPCNKVLVLTKNPLLGLRDIDLYNDSMWLGTTVITLDREKWSYWEPYTLYPPRKRLLALRTAHELGIRTWLSIEPIIPYTTYPESIISSTLDYVDYYVLGSFNYAAQLGYTAYTREELEQWYHRHVGKAIELLEQHGKLFYIKRELMRHILRYTLRTHIEKGFVVKS